MGIFNRNKNPQKGFREQKQQKPVSREKKRKQLVKQGVPNEHIDYLFMLEDNAVIANTEFNKCCQMIERLGFKPEVKLIWHATGCDSQIGLVPINVDEYAQRKKRWEEADAKEKADKVIPISDCPCDCHKDKKEGAEEQDCIEECKHAPCETDNEKATDEPEGAEGIESADEFPQCNCGSGIGTGILHTENCDFEVWRLQKAEKATADEDKTVEKVEAIDKKSNTEEK